MRFGGKCKISKLIMRRRKPRRAFLSEWATLQSGSTFDNIDRQSPLACFLVFGAHVLTGLAHRFDDGIERHDVNAVPVQCEARCINGFKRTHCISLDARNLHQTPDWIASEAEVMFHSDLRGVFNLLIASA